jgi:hypothetical protein
MVSKEQRERARQQWMNLLALNANRREFSLAREAGKSAVPLCLGFDTHADVDSSVREALNDYPGVFRRAS